jgi:hypothetical protein
MPAPAIIINGVSAAWMREVIVAPSPAGKTIALGAAFAFNNVAPGAKYTGLASESATGGDEIVDVVRADDAKFKYKKNKVEIDGLTGAAYGGGSSGPGPATGPKGATGEISFTLLQGDGATRTIHDLCRDLNEKIGSYFMACIPAGIVVDQTDPAGYAYVVGKITSNLEVVQGAYTASQLAITIRGTALGVTDTGEMAKLETPAFAAVTPLLQSVIGAISFTPDPPGAASGESLAGGRLVLT